MVQFGVGPEDVPAAVEDGGFVEVLFARTQDEAESNRLYLEEHAIPARVETDPVMPSRSGIALLVPPARLIEASEALVVKAQEDDEFDDDDDEFDLDDDSDDYEDEDDLEYDDDDPELDDEDEDDDDDLYEDDDMP